MKVKLLILALFAGVVSAMAQSVEHSSDVTLFHEYQPAIVYLKSGGVNRQKEANIFLKNSAFIYKSKDVVMEANMDVVRMVKFGDRTFEKVGSRLAEVIDTCGTNKLLLVKLINVEGLNHEILNSSMISNIDLGEIIGVTRLDADADQLTYPVDLLYYMVLDGKTALCHERELKSAVGKKRMEIFNSVTRAYGFSWTNPDDLRNLLRALSNQPAK